MDRVLLFAAAFCYFVAFARTTLALRRRNFRPDRFNFFAIFAGFLLQTAFLTIRGHALGQCPITNLFEVFTFLAWSVALIYMLVGPAYRLSLMGAFTAPLVFVVQIFALVIPADFAHSTKFPVNAWLEFHASISMIAYGAFALAGVAGLMYLLQERQLKTHQLHTIFYHLPPLPDLFTGITRLLWLGFGLYSLGVLSGFFTGQPLPRLKMTWALLVWILYASILGARHLHRLAPKRVAALCVVAFSAALALLWGITFVSQTRSL